MTSAHTTYTGSCSRDLPLATGSKGNATASAGGKLANGQPAEASQEALQEALKHLDMAALMGGPALRPALDAAISRVQRGMQAAAAIAANSSASANTPASGADGRSERDRSAHHSEQARLKLPASKRQRTDGMAPDDERPQGAGAMDFSGSASAEGLSAVPECHHPDGGVTGVAADAVDGAARTALEDAWPSGSLFTAAPPSGSLCGDSISAVELPSLERCTIRCRHCKHDIVWNVLGISASPYGRKHLVSTKIEASWFPQVSVRLHAGARRRPAGRHRRRAALVSMSPSRRAHAELPCHLRMPCPSAQWQEQVLPACSLRQLPRLSSQGSKAGFVGRFTELTPPTATQAAWSTGRRWSDGGGRRTCTRWRGRGRCRWRSAGTTWPTAGGSA